MRKTLHFYLTFAGVKMSMSKIEKIHLLFNGHSLCGSKYASSHNVFFQADESRRCLRCTELFRRRGYDIKAVERVVRKDAPQCIRAARALVPAVFIFEEFERD